jgi:VWFA-related protein
MIATLCGGVVQAQPVSAPATPGAPPAAPPPASPAASNSVPDSISEAIEVRVVSIDVVVRDKSGRQVNDLRREDFNLQVDGRKTEITNFFLNSGEAQAPVAGSPEAASPTQGTIAIPAPPLHIVVFLDNYNMSPFDRNRRVKELRTFLSTSVKPSDKIMLVTHDPGLHVRLKFGDDPHGIDALLEKIAKENSEGLNKVLTQKHTFDDIADLIRTQGCANGFDAAKGVARSYATRVLAETRLTYSNLHHLVESLGGLEGKKALLYVGDGLPHLVGSDVLGQIEELCPSQSTLMNSAAADQYITTAPMHQVIADANANFVTFFTLEASGLQSYSNQDYAGASFELLQRIALDRQDSLVALARETGGRSALNGNDFRHDLQEIAGELQTSYSLGFTPVAGASGATHSIKVEMNRPGLKVSYRNGYRDRSVKEQVEGQLEAALLYSQTANPLGATIKVGTATPADHGRFTVPLQVRVPFRLLTLIPQEDAHRGSVSFLVSDIDAHGGIAPAQHANLPLRVPESDFKHVQASQMGYDIKVVVEPGHQRLALVIRDDVSKTTSTLTQELDIDKQGNIHSQ